MDKIRALQKGGYSAACRTLPPNLICWWYLFPTEKLPCLCVSNSVYLVKTVIISVLQSCTLTSASACHKELNDLDVKVRD